MDQDKSGDPLDHTVDLHSVFAGYLGHFEAEHLDWWTKSWGSHFHNFNAFLGFGWKVMVVIDKRTGQAHIATTWEHVGLFTRMIRTRYGESLPRVPPTSLILQPSRAASTRRMTSVTDVTSFQKLSTILGSVELAHQRHLLARGDPQAVARLFYPRAEASKGGHTWACVHTTWWEKGSRPSGYVPGGVRGRATEQGVVLEVGISAVRCANLLAAGVWPPVPEDNYRKSHFIVEEWVDKRNNRSPPNLPRAYAFGESHFVAEKDVDRIVGANIGALASPSNDPSANTLILINCGEAPTLPVSPGLPGNILHVDILALAGRLGRDSHNQGEVSDLSTLLHLLDIPEVAPLSNAGNSAFYSLLAFQKLLVSDTAIPDWLRRGAESYQPVFVSPSRRTTSYGSSNPRPLLLLDTALPSTHNLSRRPKTVIWAKR